MKLTFEKMHGLGNDFVVIDNMDKTLTLTEHQIESLCDRHFGIGADGLILVEPSDNPEATGYMNYYNADGSHAQMCGNGVRCFARFLVDHGYAGKGSGTLVADTAAGLRAITYHCENDEFMATVDMGEPILTPCDVPVALNANAMTEWGQSYVSDVALESPWGSFSFTCVSMGNPHAITVIEDFESLDDQLFTDPQHKSLDTFNVDLVGKYFESHEAFPEKANIEFIYVGDDMIHMRVYERGDGETLACGTGACGVTVASHLTGRASRESKVALPGGTLDITWDETSNHVFMTGPATSVFTGMIEL